MTREQITALTEIENCRRECHQMVDIQFDMLARRLQEEECEFALGQNERALTLAALPSAFKGKKPVSLILPSGTEVNTPSWKKVVTAILQDCARDPQRREWMLELKGRVFGNFRALLAGTPEGMCAPLKIEEGLYWESKFDTEALLGNLTDKLLCKVGYDYQGVVIRYREPRQEAAIEEPAIEEQDGGPGFGPAFSM